MARNTTVERKTKETNIVGVDANIDPKAKKRLT